MLCLVLQVPGALSCTTRAAARQRTTQASHLRDVVGDSSGCAGVRSLNLQHSSLASVHNIPLGSQQRLAVQVSGARGQQELQLQSMHRPNQRQPMPCLAPAGARSPELQHQSQLVASFLERTALLARPLSERQVNGASKVPSSNPGKPQPLPQRHPPSRLHSPAEPAQHDSVQPAAQPALAQQKPPAPAGGDENGGSPPAEPVPAESPESLARQRAEEYKARGNEHHKAARWEAAIAEYTLAIETCPGVAAYHGNRQVACMKLADGTAPVCMPASFRSAATFQLTKAKGLLVAPKLPILQHEQRSCRPCRASKTEPSCVASPCLTPPRSWLYPLDCAQVSQAPTEALAPHCHSAACLLLSCSLQGPRQC